MEFEWDNSKEEENIKKHGVSFNESASTFFDPQGIRLQDTAHSHVEERFYWIGESDKGRIITTYFTARGDKIRIIGCAEWRKFRRIYYEAAKGE